MRLRYNDDPIASDGIAPRADYKTPTDYPWGQIDCKIAGEEQDSYWSIFGPTTSPSSVEG